uniref:Photosystem II reaction center protein Z n=1 Tax=Chloroparvula japonica TaxID=1411623 RepID=A0A4D6C328_9CHLO|nr:Z protein of photosystem II [Chloroparvula japonica]QBX98132.1 Z protein of photosystem II [Chloroparvula japonica]
MNILFQTSVLALIALSFLLVVGVPFTFALPDGWVNGRGLIFSGLGLWFLLVFAVGILNSFVV